jgi:glyceraldehyde 3-phosphate dehydrogenase
MAIKIGINGFGRIGRCVVRAGILSDDIQFVGINDLTSAKELAFSFKYDSVHGRFDGQVEADGDTLVINGKRIPVTAERDPSKLPWASVGADIVHECTGLFVDRDKAAKHLDAGAKYVVISAPAKGEDLTVVYGVNHTLLDLSKHKIISNASCTTNCLAPMAKVLDETFGIEQGLMTTIHSYTNTQAILDTPMKDLRRGRAAALSMIPSTTGAAKAVGKVLPQLNGKLDGMAVRVPTPNVSLTDLTATLSRAASVEELNAALKAAADGPLKGVMAFTVEETVSIDYNGDPHSCTVLGDQTRSQGKLVKVMGWYDNEWGFSIRMLDLSRYIAAHA